MAFHHVVIEESSGLHEGIDDGGAAKGEARRFERFGDGQGQRRLGRDLAVLKPVLQRAAVDERPHMVGKSLALADGEIGPCAFDRPLDLAPVADYAGVGEQAGDVSLAPRRYDFRVEPGKGCPEIVALFKDRDPAETGLKPVQNELFP